MISINKLEKFIYYDEMFANLAEAEAHIVAKKGFSESDCSYIYKFIHINDVEFKKEAIKRYQFLFNHIASKIVHVGFNELLFYRIYLKEYHDILTLHKLSQNVITRLFKWFEPKQMKDFYAHSRYYLTELNSFINENHLVAHELEIHIFLQSYLFKILKNIDLTKYFYIEKFVKEIENAYAN